MIETFIKTVISFVATGVLGYCISTIRNYKKGRDKILDEFKELKESQLLDMRSDLSAKFYIYDAMDEVDDYLVMSFREKCERYFHLGGNTWVKPMYEKSKNWKIKPTPFLK